MESKLPKTLSVSMALHVAAAGLWLYMSHIPKAGPTRVLSNVELMIAPKAVAARPAAPSTQPSTWNFLRMALPSAPVRPMDVEAPKPEARPKIARERLLNENQEKFRERLELEADKEIAHRNLQAMEDATASHASHAKLADVARLEEVGSQRASKAAIAIDDALIEAGHHGSAAPQDLSALAAAAPAPSRARAAAPMAALSDAAPTGRSRESAGSALSSLLPSEPSFSHGRTGPLSAGGDVDGAAPAPARRKVEALSENKKPAMIEGPLKNRKVLHYEIPQFPSWLQAQGVLEAIVRIRFSVDASGQVLEEMRLAQTSGYGELDNLAMESLRQWRFEPKPADSGNQWGIITFRFVVE